MKIKPLTLVLYIAVLALCSTGKVFAQQSVTRDSVVIPLWPGTPPFYKSLDPEKALPSKGDNIIRLTNISQPTLTIYPEDEKGPPKPALLISPGGGYHILAMNLEGTEIAGWARKLGFTPVILKYRVPEQRKAAFADVQRAMSILRYRAGQWNIDPERIGIIGFSAGAHLAARASTHFEKRIYKPVDQSDRANMKPDFSILIYPAYLIDKEQHTVNEEVQVHAQSPPTFLLQTQDDNTGYENSLFFYDALTRKQIPAELHIFAKGGHGYGLRAKKENGLSTWPDLCEAWLKTIEILK